MKLYNNTLSNEAVYQRFYNSARQMGLTRNIKWLSRLIYKNKIFFRDSDGNRDTILEGNHEEFIRQLSEMIEVFTRKFDNNWDIHLDYSEYYKRFKISFLIHYDKVTITNSNQRSRILTDLLVVLPLSFNNANRNLYIKDIQGARLTLEEDEWFAGYYHSHLPKLERLTSLSEVFRVNNFCIGSEDLSELEIELSVDFDADKFELMLYTIDSLVAWESLEGGPHVCMSSCISEYSQNRLNPTKNRMETIYRELNRYYMYRKNLPLDFVFIDNRYQIKHNQKFTDFIKNALLNTEELLQYTTALICKRGTDGYFYTDSRLTNSNGIASTPQVVIKNIKESMENQLPFIYIQGKKIEFNINFSTTNNPLDINEFGIYPKFLTYVSEQLESEIYKICVRGSSINKLSNSGSHVRNDVGQNQILM